MRAPQKPWQSRRPLGRRPGSKCTERLPWESYLPTRMCCKKRGSGESLVQNPVFSRAFSCACFQNPQFLHAFREKSAAGAAIHWTAARPHRAGTTEKTQGFGNMLIKMIVKTQGSASEQGQNPVFFHVFMSLDGLPYK